jgi:hypothetical protein
MPPGPWWRFFLLGYSVDHRPDKRPNTQIFALGNSLQFGPALGVHE